MSTQDTEVWLWRHKNRIGPAIPRKDYDKVANSIISEIKNNGEVDLCHLIDRIRSSLSSTIEGNLDWYLLHVKQDLAARGIIKISVNRDFVQTISLGKNHSGFKVTG